MKNKNDVIKEDIMNQILTGALSPGQAIDTDAALSKRYDASRMTVRKAVDELVARGERKNAVKAASLRVKEMMEE